MNGLNLWPWRERQRQQAMRRWIWGGAWSLLLVVLLVCVLDRCMQHWQQQREQHHERKVRTHLALQHALTDAPLWQNRWRQSQQLKTDWLRWQYQQQQAWRVLQRVLALPPSGVQIDQLDWRDKQLRITGWTVSAAHLKTWQDALSAQRVEWYPGQWRQIDGLAVRQHRFVLLWHATGLDAKS